MRDDSTVNLNDLEITAVIKCPYCGKSKMFSYFNASGMISSNCSVCTRMVLWDLPTRNPHMQTMLRLVGFGDNAGSGFPTILDVWKSEGWIKPELIEDTNLDQVTLVMKMEKESDDKSAESAEKSAD